MRVWDGLDEKERIMDVITYYVEVERETISYLGKCGRKNKGIKRIM